MAQLMRTSDGRLKAQLTDAELQKHGIDERLTRVATERLTGDEVKAVLQSLHPTHLNAVGSDLNRLGNPQAADRTWKTGVYLDGAVLSTFTETELQQAGVDERSLERMRTHRELLQRYGINPVHKLQRDLTVEKLDERSAQLANTGGDSAQVQTTAPELQFDSKMGKANELRTIANSAEGHLIDGDAAAAVDILRQSAVLPNFDTTLELMLRDAPADARARYAISVLNARAYGGAASALETYAGEEGVDKAVLKIEATGFPPKFDGQTGQKLSDLPVEERMSRYMSMFRERERSNIADYEKIVEQHGDADMAYEASEREQTPRVGRLPAGSWEIAPDGKIVLKQMMGNTQVNITLGESVEGTRIEDNQYLCFDPKTETEPSVLTADGLVERAVKKIDAGANPLEDGWSAVAQRLSLDGFQSQAMVVVGKIREKGVQLDASRGVETAVLNERGLSFEYSDGGEGYIPPIMGDEQVAWIRTYKGQFGEGKKTLVVEGDVGHRLWNAANPQAPAEGAGQASQAEVSHQSQRQVERFVLSSDAMVIRYAGGLTDTVEKPSE
ncbi:MAG: hypothetical protein KKD39_00315 [Candidatus Altiarchaeota archaeon]|nr:hypothetical protein [Candidatus Altiarchaeota archaeon]